MNEDETIELGEQVIAEMDREFHNSPDRVIAVVGAAYLDAMLDRLLRESFIDAEKEVDRLLRPEGAIGANGTRYQLAYCLGLITHDQRDDLKLIAQIRNRFAHDFKITSFDEEPMRGYCSSLKQPSLLVDLAKKQFQGEIRESAAQYVRDTSDTPREKFRTSVFALFGSLLRRVRYVQRPTPSCWFAYDPDAPSPLQPVVADFSLS